jgi:hypothetical protein
VPTWQSYLYQDFLLPSFSPNNATEWLNLNSPFGPTQHIPDYFSLAWNSLVWNDANENHFAPTPTPQAQTASIKTQPQQLPQSPPQPVQQSGPSSFCTQPCYYNTSNSKSLPTSLLLGPQYGQDSGSLRYSAEQSQDGLPPVDKIDAELVRSPSPIDSLSTHVTPNLSPKLGQKRRVPSLDSDVEHSHDEQEHEVPESVETDGMIWGMNVEDYRALSARERKRVRNRISARTFRAKRKREHGRRTFLHASVVHYPSPVPPTSSAMFLVFSLSRHRAPPLTSRVQNTSPLSSQSSAPRISR